MILKKSNHGRLEKVDSFFPRGGALVTLRSLGGILPRAIAFERDCHHSRFSLVSCRGDESVS